MRHELIGELILVFEKNYPRDLLTPVEALHGAESYPGAQFYVRTRIHLMFPWIRI